MDFVPPFSVVFDHLIVLPSLDPAQIFDRHVSMALLPVGVMLVEPRHELLDVEGLESFGMGFRTLL